MFCCRESLNHTKTLLEVGIVKWTEYEDQYQEATDWLVQTEELVQSYNKLQNTLEEKRTVLEQFQVSVETWYYRDVQLSHQLIPPEFKFRLQSSHHQHK